MLSDQGKWRSYEEVTQFLLNQMSDEIGLERVEGKQRIGGQHSGTEWEIDAKGVSERDCIFIIVECRRHTRSRQTQEDIAALAYRIHDTGASGGIIVSPLGLQAGAEKIAKAENIISVKLDHNSTTSDYLLQFLNKIRAGKSETVNLSDGGGASLFQDGKLIKKIPF